jgi:undecaprenyl-diphosphatase
VSLTAAVLLGIIQGLTEFLPVSSSAHLILARAFFGWEIPEAVELPFDVALHVGTLVAILAFFRADIAAMLRAVPRVFAPEPDYSARLIRLIVIGTIPVVIVGLAFKDFIEDVLRTPAVAAGALAFGAAMMLVAERLGRQVKDERAIGWGDAHLGAEPVSHDPVAAAAVPGRVLRHRPARHQRRRVRLDLPGGGRHARPLVCRVART